MPNCQRFIFLTAVLGLLWGTSALADQHGQDEQPATPVFVVITAEDNQTRGMALVLARQMLDQGARLRILLCGPGGELGIAGLEEAPLAPRGITPKQLLRGLIADGVQVDVCALFLPNGPHGEDQLLEGIGVAMPPEVGRYMLGEGVRYFTF
jgi:predicted peroxiredoxin